MSITKGKHTVAEIDGVRCTIIETDATKERVDFLKDLLEFNKLEVKIAENKNSEPKNFTIGVTDLIFNPVIALYDMSLKTKDGYSVSPAYWLEKTKICDLRYWRIGRKINKTL